VCLGVKAVPGEIGNECQVPRVDFGTIKSNGAETKDEKSVRGRASGDNMSDGKRGRSTRGKSL